MSFLDANLIRVTPECRDIASLAYLFHGALGHIVYSQKGKRNA
jgi:hypothetical protein